MTQASWFDGASDSSIWLPPVVKKSPYYASLIGGGGYFDSNNSRNTGLIGATLAVPVADDFGLAGMAAVNMYGRGQQYWSTVGAYRAGRYFSEGLGRLGGSVNFNQWTDTGLNSPYLVSGDYTITYTFLPAIRGGIHYVDPIAGRSKLAIVPGGPSGSIRNVEVVEAVLRVGSNWNGFNVAIGYSDPFNSMTVDFGLSRAISQRVSTQASGGYFEHVGLWYAFWGLQVDLSPAARASQLALNSRPGDVIRGTAFSLNESSDVSSGLSMNDDYRHESENQRVAELMRQIATVHGNPNQATSPGAGGGNCHCTAGDTPSFSGGFIVGCTKASDGSFYFPICN